LILRLLRLAISTVLPHRNRNRGVLTSCELRLNPDTFALELTVFDDQGNVAAVLGYNLAAKSPEVFDLDLLRGAWSRWREASAIAS
jgi:hypothetical protein